MVREIYRKWEDELDEIGWGFIMYKRNHNYQGSETWIELNLNEHHWHQYNIQNNPYVHSLTTQLLLSAIVSFRNNVTLMTKLCIRQLNIPYAACHIFYACGSDYESVLLITLSIHFTLTYEYTCDSPVIHLWSTFSPSFPFRLNTIFNCVLFTKHLFNAASFSTPHIYAAAAYGLSWQPQIEQYEYVYTI